MSRIQPNSKRKSNQIFKKSALALCVAAATSQAFAQEDAELEEVVVYGVKQSLSTAQDIKRDAATVKDVITASDIGALPDKSIVEALQRVPGVAIERFEASDDPDHFSVEGGRVTIRGLNRVIGHFNGREVFSAGASGGLNFSDIPPELVGSVEVTKNTVASQVAGGSSGTVDIITRKALDSDGLVLSGTIRGSYGDKIEELTPAVSFLASNVWDTDAGTFGALLSVSASNFTALGEGVGVYNFYGTQDFEGVNSDFLIDEDTGQIEVDPATGQPTLDTSNDVAILDRFGNEAVATPAFRINQQDNDRDRLGLAGSLQWESPNEDILATLEFIRSDSTLAWTERFVEMAEQPFTSNAINGFTAIDRSDFSYNCPSEPSAGNPCVFGSGQIDITPENLGGNLPFLTGSRAREEERLINDVSFNIEYSVSDNLKLIGDIQYVNAETSIVDNTAHGRFSNAGTNGGTNTVPLNFDFELEGNEPGLEILNLANDAPGTGGRPDNINNYYWRSNMDHLSANEGDQIALSFDIEYTFEDSWLQSVKSGVRFANRDVTVKESIFNWGNVTETWASPTANFADIQGDGLVEQFTFDDHLSGDVLTNGIDTFWFPALSLLQGPNANNLGLTLRDNDNFSGWNPESRNNAWRPLAAREGADADGFLQSEIFETEEDRTSLYVQVDFGDEDADQPWSGNVGLRYVQWQSESTGAPTIPTGFGEAAEQDLDPSIDPDAVAFADGQQGILETIKGDKFSRVLPSFNFKYGVNDDLIFRFAASESVWFPTLFQLRNALPVGAVVTRFEDANGDLTGAELNRFVVQGGGNPLLNPEISSNFDIALEYYFADVGSLTGTLFRKRVRDFHRQTTTDIEVTNPRYLDRLVNPPADSGEAPVPLDVATERATQTVENISLGNGGTAVIEGFEIAFQTTFDIFNDDIEILQDFGLQASYTKIDGREVGTSGLVEDFGPAATGDDGSGAAGPNTGGNYGRFTNLPVEGLSKDNYNLVLFYDNATFNARLAYSWRSRYLLNSRDVIAFKPVYGEATGQLDASFSYQINDNFKVGLEANNLLDEVTRTSIQYNQEGQLTPRNYFVNDRRFALFVSATY